MTMDGVAQLMAELPEVVEGEGRGGRTWSVNGKGFAWERPFSKADIKRFGEEGAPDGPILAVRVADLHEKDAVLAAGHAGVFTIPHFNGYPAVLIQLKRAPKTAVRDILVDGWSAYAPPSLVEQYLSARTKARGRARR
jgi:hypothetical protein